jgi:hypothetical protein
MLWRACIILEYSVICLSVILSLNFVRNAPSSVPSNFAISDFGVRRIIPSILAARYCPIREPVNRLAYHSLAALAAFRKFQRLSASRSPADMPALLIWRNLLGAGNRNRPVGGVERTIDLAAHCMIGGIVGLDDDGFGPQRSKNMGVGNVACGLGLLLQAARHACLGAINL